MLLEIEVENLQNTLTEVSKMRQYSVSLFGKSFFDIQALSCLPRIRTRRGIFFDLFSRFLPLSLNRSSEEKLNFKYGIFYLNRFSSQSHPQCAHSQQRFKEKQ